jgi:excisionase family DNA binding protein
LRFLANYEWGDSNKIAMRLAAASSTAARLSPFCRKAPQFELNLTTAIRNSVAMDRDDYPEGKLSVIDVRVRPSARVSKIAELLDCDESQVRRLVRSGQLQSHRIGKRGLRIYLDSVVEYQEWRASSQNSRREERKAARSMVRSSHKAAIEKLKRRGLMD